MNEEYVWKDVGVVGFDELMQALERADRKGYMPDAVKEAWEGFNWKPARQRHISYACPQCHWSLEEQPAQRTWVGLTPEQRATIAEANNMLVDDDLFDAIEAKLKEKNE